MVYEGLPDLVGEETGRRLVGEVAKGLHPYLADPGCVPMMAKDEPVLVVKEWRVPHIF